MTSERARDVEPFERARRTYLEVRAEAAVRALEQNGFRAHLVPSGEAAARAVLEMIGEGACVGLGGSLTLRQLGLPALLEARGVRMAQHWKAGLSPEEGLRVRREQLTADVFLTSVNAVTLQGELISVDGIGNRVAATIFGPGRVIVVAGANKVVRDVSEGLARVRNVAAPINALRLGVPTPCAELGYCTDCRRPERICRVVTIIERKPALTDLTVLLVPEELGI